MHPIDPATGDGPGVAVVAPGAGSTPDFLHRAMGSALDAAGITLVTTSGRSGSADQIAAEIDAIVEDAQAGGSLVRLVGGVSVGAHAAASWASGRPDEPAGPALALWLPAWTGIADQPGETGEVGETHEAGSTGEAAGQVMTAWAAQQVTALGSAAVLADLDRDDDLREDWVTRELVRAWPTFGDDALIRILAEASQSAAPRSGELQRIALPTVVYGLAGDPFHPLATAVRWARAIPGARLLVADRSVGRSGVGALGIAATIALGS